MRGPSYLCLLWLGLLWLRFSLELSTTGKARKLCGRHLLKEIVKLCGKTNWSHFEEETPHRPLLSQATKVEAFIPDQFQSSQTTFQAWGRGTNPVSMPASQEEAINSGDMQSLHEYQHKKANLLPDKTKKLSLLQDINPYIHKLVEFQKKNTYKIKTLSNLFWGDHPQRKRRGYSEKCCLKGCTKEELSIACRPYIDYKSLKKKDHQL
ncbi:Insulin-like peptide INSL6 [Galemys pyrenaicus]|uniref:Insulin-like peptide INSL6 n=1 Tax=Galemys pyrenaicus TaxID=202257 RepID=A0A8J6AUQ0_GALPY|nr:Insulin-like peptide INSL6 [Galemys pyrenaicus]